MGTDKQWSPLEALKEASVSLPDAQDESLLKSLGISQGVMERIQDAIYAARTSGSRADDDVFAALLEARGALDKAWGPHTKLSSTQVVPKALFDGIDAAIHRGHMDYVADVATQMPKANVGDLYDNDPRYASALVHLIPNFEYPDWSWKSTLVVGREVAKLEVGKGTLVQEKDDQMTKVTSNSSMLYEIARNSTGLLERRKPVRTEEEAREIATALAHEHGEAFQIWNDKRLIDVISPSQVDLAIQSKGLLAAAKDMGLDRVDAGKLTALLETGEGPNRGMFVGKIVGVDAEKGLVFQATGRGDGVVLPLGKLSRPVEVGEMATITFKDGRGTVADRGQAQARGR